MENNKRELKGKINSALALSAADLCGTSINN